MISIKPPASTGSGSGSGKTNALSRSLSIRLLMSTSIPYTPSRMTADIIEDVTDDMTDHSPLTLERP